MVGMEGCERESDGGIFKASNLGSILLKHNLNLPLPDELPGTAVMISDVIVADAAFPLHCNMM